MTDRLQVVHEDRLVGELVRGETGRMAFRYDGGWLQEGFAISVSLPLDRVSHDEVAHRFFVNLLPEGAARTWIARRLGISEDNDWELLRALGGDCAGALSVVEEGRAGGMSPGYEDLDLARLQQLNSSRDPVFPQLGGATSLRLSLAGAQDKLPVRVAADGRLQVPVGSAASTHILKFAGRDFAHLTANEVFTTWLARRLGLGVVDATLETRLDPPGCLVTRYDRRLADGQAVRLHQEDLCQALGLPPARKYEQEGGPGMSKIRGVIEDHCADPAGDISALISWASFLVLSGNADGHAKNLSLLYARAVPQLAPFYDLISTSAYHRLSRSLAIAVGGRADPGQIGAANWRCMGTELGVTPRFVTDRVAAMAESVCEGLDETADAFRDAYGESPILQMLPPQIRRQARRTLQLLSS